MSLAVHIHTKLKTHRTQTWYSTQGVQTSGYHVILSRNAVSTCAKLSNITMHALMPYKTALMPECLITYCTSVRAITTMCGSMLPHGSFD